MSKYGLETHSYNVQAAKDYGVLEAVMLFNLRFWIDKNKKNKHNFKEGRTWTYNSITAFQEQFPYLSQQQLQRIITSLVDKNVIIKTSKFNKWKNDRTNWYAFVNEGEWFEALELKDQKEDEHFGVETLFGSSKSNDQIENGIQKVSIEAENQDNYAVGEAGSSKSNDQIEKTTKMEVGDSKSINDIHRNRMMDDSKSNEHYQIITKLKTNDEEKKQNFSSSTFELLFNKKPIEAYSDGTAKKLAFDFSNMDLVNKKIEQLFRMFVKDAAPIQIHIDQIRVALLNDARMILSHEVCWVIIQLAFMEYPGVEKKYQNFNSLLRKIGWKKDDFMTDFNAINKKKELNEAAQSRVQSKKEEEERLHNERAEMVKEIGRLIEKYRDKLSAAEVNDINKYLAENKPYDAHGTLYYYLEDIHKIKVEAA